MTTLLPPLRRRVPQKEVPRREPGLETQLPEAIDGNAPGRLLPGRNLALPPILGLPSVPDQQESGRQGYRSQQTDDQGANETSSLEDSAEDSRGDSREELRGHTAFHKQDSCRFPAFPLVPRSH